MTDKFLKQLHTIKNEIRLDPAAKQRILQTIFRGAPITQAARSWFSISTRFAATFAGIGLVVLTGGGVSAAAERALPGDILYPVKVSVNEEVRSLIALTPERRAAWDTERAVRRLDEARALAESGEVSEEAVEQLTESFAAHTDDVRVAIEAMRTRGDVESALRVASQAEEILRAGHEGRDRHEGDEEEDEADDDESEDVEDFTSSTRGRDLENAEKEAGVEKEATEREVRESEKKRESDIRVPKRKRDREAREEGGKPSTSTEREDSGMMRSASRTIMMSMPRVPTSSASSSDRARRIGDILLKIESESAITDIQILREALEHETELRRLVSSTDDVHDDDDILERIHDIR